MSTIFNLMVAVIIPVVLSTIISILLSLYICCYAIKHYIAATAEDERKFMGEITKITDEAFARIGKR